MPSVLQEFTTLPAEWSAEDLHDHLGGVPLSRIRLAPAPGRATADDVARIRDEEGRLFELIDGVLVEKTGGAYESYLAGWIITAVNNYLAGNDVGFTLGADGALRILPERVRIPDVSFICWNQRPTKTVPTERVPSLFPNLAVEVLSRSNTTAEIDAKIDDYFRAGTKLVWIVDPIARSVTVYTVPDDSSVLDESQNLEGGGVLPGFCLPLTDLFNRAGDRNGE